MRRCYPRRPDAASRSVPFGIVEEVRIWQAWLDRDGWPGEEALPADERRRAESIVIEGRRRRWVAARWALRTALGRHTGVDPAEIALEAGPGGKPRLSGIEHRSGSTSATRESWR